MLGREVRVGHWCVLFSLLAAACGADGGSNTSKEPDPPTSEQPATEASDVPPDLPPEALNERPWEVVSKKGETFLANVFYAEPSENEQVMPWKIDDRAVIDRLVYPTIGNPNLFVKDEADDELVLVLRIEPDAYQHLAPKLTPEGTVNAVTLTEDEKNNFSFFLVRKGQRDAAESPQAQAPRAGVIQIKPTKVLQNVEPADMPAALKKRKTLRFVFDKQAMANVPAGLYDTRFEVRKAGEVFASVFEYQYNSVRVYDSAPEEYRALNVTDTQVSVDVGFKNLTAEKLDDFVDAVNLSNDPDVKSAAFITFNGDLHNGGSPGTLRIRSVATTYNNEAKRILGALKRLEYPIFLTAGNHDGYAALGHVPSAIASVDGALGVTLESVIKEQNNVALPGYSWAGYNAFLQKTDNKRDGLHLDLYTGGFTRKIGQTYGESFQEIPRGERNIVLYDGFHQWQKTYGPLVASWTFGKNRYVSINSYELRQHRRTGWGMYTVNYGGAISRTQMEWIDRELQRGKNANEDIVLLMHHDPRGGHKGKDFGYYFPMLEYRSVQQSTINYLLNEVFTPAVCKQPDWSISVEERESCLHDGLQEWMAPDEDFEREGAGFYMSGIEILKRVVKHTSVRTLLIGHAHFNTLEVLQGGDQLVPNKVNLDPKSQIASFEAANPVRRFAWEGTLGEELGPRSLDAWRPRLDAMLESASPPRLRTLSNETAAGPRELAILRLTSGADLSSQKYGMQSAFGFSILHLTKQSSEVSRINRVSYFIHAPSNNTYAKVQTVDVDRTKSIPARGEQNPADALFDW